MIEVLVWMLITSSSFGSGTTTVIGNFKTQAQCEHVKANLPNKSRLVSACIQANIYMPKAAQ